MPEYDGFYISIKYDGNYVQFEYSKAFGVPYFVSSGGKPFTNKALARQIAEQFKFYDMPEKTYEAEYLGDSEGKLGDRIHAAVTTTLRTEFHKNIESNYPDHQIKIFDYIDTTLPFSSRLKKLQQMPADNGLMAQHTMCYSLANAKQWGNQFISEGYEGVIIKSGSHMYLPGKRVKTALKYKGERVRLQGTIVGGQLGEGKYREQLGSLEVKFDDMLPGVHLVGSGLTDFHRALPITELIGRVVHIECERISPDGNLIHPVLISIGSIELGGFNGKD